METVLSGKDQQHFSKCHVADIRIGTRMACTGNSNGAWVVIDDVNLMAADALTDEEASYIEPVDTDKSALNAVIEAAEKLSEKMIIQQKVLKR